MTDLKKDNKFQQAVEKEMKDILGDNSMDILKSWDNQQNSLFDQLELQEDEMDNSQENFQFFNLEQANEIYELLKNEESKVNLGLLLKVLSMKFSLIHTCILQPKNNFINKITESIKLFFKFKSETKKCNLNYEQFFQAINLLLQYQNIQNIYSSLGKDLDFKMTKFEFTNQKIFLQYSVGENSDSKYSHLNKKKKTQILQTDWVAYGSEFISNLVKFKLKSYFDENQPKVEDIEEIKTEPIKTETIKSDVKINMVEVKDGNSDKLMEENVNLKMVLETLKFQNKELKNQKVDDRLKELEIEYQSLLSIQNRLKSELDDAKIKSSKSIEQITRKNEQDRSVKELNDAKNEQETILFDLSQMKKKLHDINYDYENKQKLRLQQIKPINSSYRVI